jgi:uncharacterized membrane protein YsdA (DUF1294 family)
MLPTILALAALFLANAATLLAFALDKRAARQRKRRIPERTLLLLAFSGGSLGAAIGQHWLRHKTVKQPFRSRLQAISAFQSVLLAAAAFYLLAPRMTAGLIARLTMIVGL